MQQGGIQWREYIQQYLADRIARLGCGLDAEGEREGRTQDDCQLNGLRNWMMVPLGEIFEERKGWEN